MDKHAEAIVRIVRADDELQARMEQDAKATAHGLIQGYLGPDHKVRDMCQFYSALVQALKAARAQGQADCRGDVAPFA